MRHHIDIFISICNTLHTACTVACPGILGWYEIITCGPLERLHPTYAGVGRCDVSSGPLELINFQGGNNNQSKDWEMVQNRKVVLYCQCVVGDHPARVAKKVSPPFLRLFESGSLFYPASLRAPDHYIGGPVIFIDKLSLII